MTTMTPQTPDLLVVVGMHRSGTSAFSRALAALGCVHGDHLIEAIPGNNEKGFWEDSDINTIDQELLEALGTSWFRIGELGRDVFSIPYLAPFRQRATEMLASKIQPGKTFALKEPRMTLLLPFWQDIFQRMGLQVGYILAVRHPLEVAQSLLRRDGFSLQRGLLLWHQYSVLAWNYTCDANRMVISFDQLLQAPNTVLQAIAQHFYFPEIHSDALTDYTGSFLDDSLRHHRVTGRDLPPPINRLYEHLLIAASQGGFAQSGDENAPYQTDPAWSVHREIIVELETTLATLQMDFQHEQANHQQQIATYNDLARTHQALLDEHQIAMQLAEQDWESRLESTTAEISRLQGELNAVYSSRSWKLTLPLRKIWRKIPMRMETRARLKAKFTASHLNTDNITDLAEKPKPIFVRCRTQTPETPFRSIRMIAFHLPQFHEIPENNQWWGKGFTEWSNVRPATQLFKDHYQPHIPLGGYYDLGDADSAVLAHQTRLARSYGIEGFCFYFYWFKGHRLLETPLLHLLQHRDWDVSFCLCWANENWTRRWDGLEQDILIGQEYSAQDDLNFIEYISQYLRDPRYIRVDGKPILLLYRPDLLPDPEGTIVRWRKYCKDNGIGEIFIAYPQSFENRDPRIYGMDAAVEFPPNNSAPPELHPEQFACVPEFSGHIYDWSVFPKRAQSYKQPDYLLFRGLNPGWDNTARRKNNATIFVNNDPCSYQKWAFSACQDTLERIPESDQRLIFINAWNEWAEGAHLEPDLRTGCAYLEATDMARARAEIRHRASLQKVNPRRLAIVVHAFYLDVFEEILEKISALPQNSVELWITAPAEHEQAIKLQMSNYPIAHHLIFVKNKGRDVLPFLQALPEIIAREDIGYLIKVHTKKSLHREDGVAWRRNFFDKLLCKENIALWMSNMESDGNIGMYAPKEYIVPMSLFWGSNASKVSLLGERLGVDNHTIHEISFVAGTMFFCRIEAVYPIHLLNLSEEDFERKRTNRWMALWRTQWKGHLAFPVIA